jgi:hypothetical protein
MDVEQDRNGWIRLKCLQMQANGRFSWTKQTEGISWPVKQPHISHGKAHTMDSCMFSWIKSSPRTIHNYFDTVHFLCNCLIYTSFPPTNCTVDYISPTCFASDFQPKHVAAIKPIVPLVGGRLVCHLLLDFSISICSIYINSISNTYKHIFLCIVMHLKTR